jgi:predicted glycosyltransferase involved in capsule biosynthesis
MPQDEASAVTKFDSVNCTLTVIITLRVARHYDMISRLRNRLLDTEIPDSVSFLVVDEGSDLGDSQRMSDVCAELGFRYFRIAANKVKFCAATARNIGAALASSEFIMHEDVDLFPYSGFYRDLIEEIKIQRLDRHSNRFITVPTLYLSDIATEKTLTGKISKNELLHDFLTSGPLVQTYLPASSAIVVNRMFYLSIGGYNDQFSGWGLEDLEYAYRLTRGAAIFLPPEDHQWLIEGGYATNPTYRGWRAQFRLHGELLSRKGIFIYHAHHPKDEAWRNRELHSNNKVVFARSIEQFDIFGHHLPPIPALENGRSLIFGKGTFAYNPSLLPLWGDLEVKGYDFFMEKDIVEYISSNNIDQVIFTNPYANEQRLKVYRQIREASIPFFVVERGALTDSMFIDDTGFCCESTRYRREHWPQEIDECRRQLVLDYISSETASASALEKQGERLGGRSAMQKLGIPAYKKVLFVPFQSRSDTTVNHFAGPIGSFDNFVELVRSVTRRLSSDWVVVFKNHPLSSMEETIPGAIDINDMHIKDVLELTDYVLLMNSGVGVLSVLFDKPVIHAATAFYSDKGLNRASSTPDEVLTLLNDGFSLDQDSRIKFLSYLIDDFYSFGKFTVTEKEHTDNARLTITERIEYYRVNFLGKRILNTQVGSNLTDTKAPVYDIFREWLNSRKLQKPTLQSRLHIQADSRDSVSSLISSGRAAFHQKKYAEASAMFDSASAQLPFTPTHFREAAEAYYRMGNVSVALDRLEKAVSVAQNKTSINRRIRDMKRPRFLSVFSKPYPVERT